MVGFIIKWLCTNTRLGILYYNSTGIGLFNIRTEVLIFIIHAITITSDIL
jgi:hypothetical protein